MHSIMYRNNTHLSIAMFSAQSHHIFCWENDAGHHDIEEIAVAQKLLDSQFCRACVEVAGRRSNMFLSVSLIDTVWQDTHLATFTLSWKISW